METSEGGFAAEGSRPSAGIVCSGSRFIDPSHVGKPSELLVHGISGVFVGLQLPHRPRGGARTVSPCCGKRFR